MPTRKKAVRRKKVAAGSVGLTAAETKREADGDLAPLARDVEADGGAVLGAYNDPFGGKPLLIAALPVSLVEPTPYQRDPSDAHVKRLMAVVEKIGSFLDPIIAVRHDDRYWTPNGNHRLQALKKLGVRTIIALVVPDADVAFKILALNTEKAHNLREKSLETIRMARALATTHDEPETAFAFEFEQPAFLTLGVCYESRPRLSGGAYQPILRRVDEFLEERISKALKERERRGKKILGTRRCGRRGRREVEGEGAHEPVSETVRRLASELHAILEGNLLRLRRNAGQDHRQRAQVQRRSREAGGCREGGRRKPR